MLVLNEILVFITLLAADFQVSISGCHCPEGCSAPPAPCTLPCARGWSGPFCQRKNIALGKATQQTGSFNDTAYCPSPDPNFGPLVCGVKGPGLAVDGNTDHIYWHGSCSHTIPHNSPARWSVDLVGSHIVNHLEIHLDEDQQSFLNTFTVTVDGQWCQNWTQSANVGLIADITCSHPLHGSNLTIQSFPGQANQDQPMLDLCEVEIYECSDFWFGLSCDKQCHCRNKTEVCDKVTGNCSSGCAVARFGSDCQLVDIAYKKPTFQRSSDDHVGNVASLTVDGDPGSCTTDLGLLSFWSVDLAKTVDINSIRIHSRNNLVGGINGFNVTVDGRLCYESSSHTAPTGVIDIKCTGYLAGSNVSIVMTSSGEHSLDLCEVEVFECADYTYGASCDMRCNCRDVTEVCNRATGQCDSGCRAGWTGVNCQQAQSHTIVKKSPLLSRTDPSLPSSLEDVTQCRNGTYLFDGQCKPCSTCLNDTCNTRNGRCNFGCKPGYLTPMCNKQCPFRYYGDKCFYECGTCRNNETCHYITGQCESGCAQNFTGTFCKECIVGNYGRDCDGQCGECQDTNSCEKHTGDCSSGCRHNTVPPLCQVCPRGKYGPTCDKECGFCKYGQNCDRQTGMCTVGCRNGAIGDMCKSCAEGFYGDGCYHCGYCANNRTCDSKSGICSDGCEPGWAGHKCTLDCPHGFYGHNCSLTCGHCKGGVFCDSRTGHCPSMTCSEGYMGDTCKIECRKGTFGPNCRFPCGHCLHNVSCDIYNGSCPRDRCMPGYMNPRCQRGCPDGRYGNGCAYFCENCENGCNPVTGICLEGACVTGWSGEMCMEAISHSKPGVVAAAVIVPLIVIGIVASLLFLWWRRRRRDNADRGMTDGTVPDLGREGRKDIQMGGRFESRESEGRMNEGFRRDRYTDMPKRDRREEGIEEYAMPKGPSDRQRERRINGGFRRDRFSNMPRRDGSEREGTEEYVMPRGPSDRQTQRRINEGSMEGRYDNMPSRGRENRDTEDTERDYDTPRKVEMKKRSRDGRYSENDARRKERFYENLAYKGNRFFNNEADSDGAYSDNEVYKAKRYSDIPLRDRYDDESDEEREDNEPLRGRFPDVHRNQRTFDNMDGKPDRQNPRTNIHIDYRRQRPSVDLHEADKMATEHRDNIGNDIQTESRTRDMCNERRSNDIQFRCRSVDI